VCLDRTVPFVFSHVEDHAFAKDAVGADEDVEFAVLVNRRGDETFGDGHVGDIADHRRGGTARLRDLVDDGVDAGGVDTHPAFDIGAGVGNDHGRALLGEDLADLTAHAARASGDDGDFAFQMFVWHCEQPPHQD
jgi:hypothetical protein